MPKLKTHKGASKRIKQSKRGKMLRRRGGGNHFLEKKSGSRKRGYAGHQELNHNKRQTVRRQLGE